MQVVMYEIRERHNRDLIARFSSGNELSRYLTERPDVRWKLDSGVYEFRNVIVEDEWKERSRA